MPLNNPHPFSDVYLSASTLSISLTPAPASVVSPVAGILVAVLAAADGTTAGTAAIAVSINGGADVTGGGLTVPAGTGARNNPAFPLSKVGIHVVEVSEGDVITFTPSGGTSATIPGSFAAVIRQHS